MRQVREDGKLPRDERGESPCGIDPRPLYSLSRSDNAAVTFADMLPSFGWRLFCREERGKQMEKKTKHQSKCLSALGFYNVADVRSIVTLGVLLAAEIILSRFLSISTPIVKIGFSFVPIAVAALMYGPIWAGLLAGMGDFLGAIIFPIGLYFPGFTLSALISGVIFGLFLYNKKASVWRTAAATALSLLICSFVLDTLWLYLINSSSEQTLAALLPSRAIKLAVMLPVEFIVVTALAKQRLVPLAARRAR